MPKPKSKSQQAAEPIHLSIGPEEVDQISLAAGAMVEAVRDHMCSPDSRKTPPTITSTDISNITKLTKFQVQHYMRKYADLPRGKMVGNRLEFSLADGRQIIKRLTPEKQRKRDVSCAITIAIANFKGGVTKTTTTATLAQALSLRGYEVLVIDLDPQGSLSTLYGILPDIDVEDGQTIMELYAGDQPNADYAIRPTYWAGVDIIAGSPELHNAEFMLPSRQHREEGFNFWGILDAGLDSARERYDIILIDTAPSLNYSTVNALMAADGIIMPLPPSPLDFASSASFWQLCNDIMKRLVHGQGKGKGLKKFYFIDVVLCRVDKNVGVSALVRDWIIRAYGSKVLPVEIPKTSIADTAAAGFGTVYDLSAYTVNRKNTKASQGRLRLLS